MGRPFEPVYTVIDYWDGPRAGVASLDGHPHAYESIFNEAEDEWDPDRFRLSAIPVDVLHLALEDWEVWRRFERAYHRGEISPEDVESNWGALPEDRDRHAELQRLLTPALRIDPTQCRLMHGEFRAREPLLPQHTRGTLRPLEVRWTPAE